MSVSTALPSSSMPPSALLHAPRALERERLGDDADRERALVARDLRDDRRRAGAGAAAHAGGDEHHVGALQRLGDALRVLERRLAADLGVGARAEALGEVRAELDLDAGARLAASAWLSVFAAMNSTPSRPRLRSSC